MQIAEVLNIEIWPLNRFMCVLRGLSFKRRDEELRPVSDVCV